MGRESLRWHVKQNHGFSSALGYPAETSVLFIWKVVLEPAGTGEVYRERSSEQEEENSPKSFLGLYVFA